MSLGEQVPRTFSLVVLHGSCKPSSQPLSHHTFERFLRSAVQAPWLSHMCKRGPGLYPAECTVFRLLSPERSEYNGVKESLGHKVHVPRLFHAHHCGSKVVFNMPCQGRHRSTVGAQLALPQNF